ncbi:MFS general substrate transporter [Coniochaeta ligniaria NRRL 30616]|uniref:MFS general substrate transporter n=1 Tax=Coniochaeta ligniaria NRRL 30616 TaxID=1408157 RepID=A0A1J7JT13_9PEZI|nr:MFS general substrate transporter [Coniochaeta ligniaria NRRL 30616]
MTTDEKMVDVEAKPHAPSSTDGDKAVGDVLLDAAPDEALKLVGLHRVEIDEETNKRICRKIDFHMLPIMCTLYGLQYLDKTTLSYASILGLMTDTHISSYQYGWTGSIFYAGYLVFEWPHNRLLQRFPVVKYLSIMIALWGACLACMAACHNFAGLMVVRTALGALEGSITPAFILITASWYRGSEQTARIAIWCCANGAAQIIGGAIFFGVARGFESNPSITFAGWKVVFILTGLLTVLLGVALWFCLPSSIPEARWLTDEEKRLAIERLRVNEQGIGNKQFKMYQFKEALTDVRTWLYFLLTLSLEIPSGGTTVFFSKLIQSYGFNTQTSILISMPGGVVQIATALFFCVWLLPRLKRRCLTGALATLLSIFGPSLMLGLQYPNDPLHARIGQIVGYYITIGNSPVPWIIGMGLYTINSAGHTKKTTVNALNLIAYCIGFLVGPQIFRDPPDYRKAKMGVIVCWCVSFCIFFVIWWVNVRENKRRDERDRLDPPPRIEGHEFLDLTDFENRYFRYAT